MNYVGCVFSYRTGGGKLLMENGVIQIGYSATEDDLTNRVYNNFVRTNAPRGQEGYVIPMLTYDVFQWTRVAFVKAYTTYGFHSSFKYDIYFTDRLGIPLNEIERTDHIIYPIQTDYTDVINEIRATKFNIMCVYADAGHGSAFLLAAYQQGLIHSGMQLIIASDLTEPTSWTFQLNNLLPKEDIASLMKGAIGFRPLLNRSIPEAREFVRRFRALPSTLGYNATSGCDNSTDSVGKYINQNDDGSKCAGLNFSSLDPGGEDVVAGAFYAYDAVTTLALSLHRYLHVEHLENLIQTAYHYYYLMQSMNFVEFDGATGHISFEPFPDRQNNDRLTDMLYEVVNFHADIYLDASNTNLDKGFVRVGFINTDSGFSACDRASDGDCESFQFNTKNEDDPPSDRPQTEVLRMNLVMQALLIVVSVLVLLLVVFLAMSILYFKNRKLVKILQPEFGLLVFSSCIILAAAGFVATKHVTVDTCVSMFWMMHIGCSLLIIPLVSKTARINIVLNGKLRKVKISLLQTFLLALILLIPIVVGVSVVVAADTFKVGHREITKSLETHTEELLCIHHSGSVVTFMYVYEAVLMLTGLLLCYPIRKLPAGISDVAQVAKGTQWFILV